MSGLPQINELLAHTRASSPLTATYVVLGSRASRFAWEQQLVGHELVFLRCHRVGKVPLLPGTCYIEMARNMAIAIHGKSAFTLASAVFENIIFLDMTDLKHGPHMSSGHGTWRRKLSNTALRNVICSACGKSCSTLKAQASRIPSCL